LIATFLLRFQERFGLGEPLGHGVREAETAEAIRRGHTSSSAVPTGHRRWGRRRSRGSRTIRAQTDDFLGMKNR